MPPKNKKVDIDEIKSVKSKIAINNEISESSSDDEPDNVPKKRGMNKKSVTFSDERAAIIKKLDDLLYLTDKNRWVCINDITEETKKKIIGLVPEVKKFYTYSRWKCFRDNEFLINCAFFIKAVYRDDGYCVETISAARKNVMISVLKIYKTF